MIKKHFHKLWCGAATAAMLAFASLPAVAQDEVLGQPTPGGIGFQTAVTPQAEAIHNLHNILLVVIVVIVAFVTALLLWVMFRYNKGANATPSQFSHNSLLEVVWTAVPVLILVGVAIPSFQTLVYLEQVPEDADFTIKATGQNWYWDYEYPDHGAFYFSSNMLTKEEAAARGVEYLLGVNEPMVIPVGSTVRMQITSGERLHSWTIPAFGVKQDGVPGRLNETWFTAEREGVFFGQCSELCGALHAYMPIEVHVVSDAAFDQWVSRMQTEYGALETNETKIAQLR